ncbi:similar to An13g01700 [Aspergillus luchuensis]|uniref:Similar to An13g01700 n=1 Tax=Aspergillus kawachii TaxID=1069201 RepID=A0A146FC31_ASPKA|nr:similar to An13g01700 [Aspergillus luchuensis IFO 4308]GAT23021.1 similar to An13g01700 [Aspergillus luchuensis]
MDNIPSEVVFSTGPLPSESVVFEYTNGPLKISPPKRRGRPAGSRKKKQHLEGSRRRPAAASNFKFVNLGPTLAPIDEEERTTIRSHTMINRTRQDQRKAEITPGDTSLELSRLTHIHIPHAYPQKNQTDPFDTLPITMEPYMLDLFAFCE